MQVSAQPAPKVYFPAARWTRWLPLVLVIGASLILTLPLWQTRFMWTADGRLHMLRIYELNEALRQGIVYPRWSENLYFGYGYPVFNFYSPLSYYIVETWHLLGFDLIDSLKLFFALCFPLAALGTYVLARDVFAGVLTERWQNEAASVLAAIAYAAAPYLLIDIYVRGAIAEMIAMALLPFLIWALRRTVFQRGWSGVALTALTLALLILSHNLTTYFAVPVLFFYVLVLLFLVSGWRARLEAVGRLTLGGVIGLGLSAFYWMPAFLEMSLVYVGQPEVANIPLRQRLTEHFLSLGRVLEFSWFYNYVDAPWPLGLAALVLAIIGLVLAWRWLNKQLKLEMVYWGVVVLVITVLLTDIAEPLWLAIPRLWVIQFPWRLTVFWTMGVSLLVGLVGVALAKFFRERPLVAWGINLLLIMNLVVIALLNLHPSIWRLPEFQDVSVGMIARDEVVSRVPGASFFEPPIAEYLPFSVKGVPFPQLRARKTLDAVPINPPTVELVSQKAQDWQLRVSSADPISLTLRSFYYPDWHASLDSTALTPYPATDFGLVGVDLPAGDHTVSLTQSTSPSMFLGNLLTSAGLLAFAALIVLSFIRRETDWYLPLVGAALILPFFLFPMSRALTAAPLSMTPTQVDVGGSNDTSTNGTVENPVLRIIGYGVEDGVDNKLNVHLIWQVLGQIPDEQSTKLRLVDEQGKVIAAREQYARFGTGWMVSWIPNMLAKDQYELALPDQLECKPYFLEIKRGAKSDFVRLGPVTIPDCPLAPLRAESDFKPVDARFGKNIALVGLEPSHQSSYAPGQMAKLVLYWRADADLLEDYNMTIQLIDREGHNLAQADGTPEWGYSPTSLWLPGRIVRDTRELEIPANTSPGLLDVKVGVYKFPSIQHLPVQLNGTAQDDDLVTVGTIRIAPIPPRNPPAVNLNLSAGNSIRLLGADAETFRADSPRSRVPGGDRLSVNATRSDLLDLNLFWQRSDTAPLARDYTVFMHVIDDAGQLATQIDRQPVLGNYPTSLWQQNETITDPYEIDLGALKPGHYTIYAGMYDNATGTRLALTRANGQRLPDDRVQIADVVISE